MTNASPIPTRYQIRIKQRLRVLEYARENGIRPASRHFSLTRKTIRTWRDRYAEGGPAGLLPRYPKERRGRLHLPVRPERAGGVIPPVVLFEGGRRG